MYKGLSTEEANQKIKQFGYNELASSKPKTVWRIAFEVVKEPMFLMLLACGSLYMVLGDYKEGIILLSTIIIIINITFFQHRKTEKALEALKKLSSPRALVIRDSKEIRIPGREVMPGDLVIINEGDRIPADGILIESLNLQVDESIITGESLAVQKKEGTGENLILSGSLVTKGHGIVEIKSIGNDTEFGRIGKSLESIVDEQTRLQKEMKKLIRNLGIIGILLSILVVAIFYFTRGNFIQSLLNGLSAAMAILPEEFPVVLTVFMALGAWRLSKKNVLTRNPSAIETLGSATILCSDKTGTITQNKMIVSHFFKASSHIVKNEFQKQLNDVSEMISIAYRATELTSVDPMEKAIISCQQEFAEPQGQFELIHEFPFDHELMAMTRIHRLNSTTLIASTKGAPEAIFKLCKLDSKSIHDLTQEVVQIASKGMRVIAIASCELNSFIAKDQTELPLTFSGLIGFEDPIRPEVPAAVNECRTAGIRVMMITGDFPETAKNIGSQIGLESSELLTGDQLNNLSDEELSRKLKTISILARVKPEQKLRIVQALKNNNEIVAMTGDGVNDAPALKAADIGISMGEKGTDVAREASSLVLIDDNFTSIVSAIRMGRKIFDNLQKAMSYILAIHIPIIGLTLFPAIFPYAPLLLMPLHIVFMELIIDPVSSIAFESEDEELNIMARPPRDPNQQFFGKERIIRSILDGLLLFSTVLAVFFLTHKEGHTDFEIRTITFSALIIGNVFLILSKLSTTRSFIHIFTSSNKSAKWIILIAISFLILVISTPGLTHLFSFEYPGIKHLLISFGSAGIMLIILESIKFIQRKKG